MSSETIDVATPTAPSAAGVFTDAATTAPLEPAPSHVRRAERPAWRTWALRVLAGVLLLALGIAAGAAAMAVRDVVEFRADLDGRILPGATVAGVDVGGMTEAEALAAVQATIRPALERTVALVRGEGRWETTPADLGATDDSAAVVAAAMAAGPERTLVEMARLRWVDKEIDFARDVAISRPDEGARRWVESIAAAVNAPPVDAGVDYSSGWVEIRHEQEGVTVDVDASTDAFLAMLDEGGDEAELVASTTAPAVTTADYRQVLLLRQDERKLYLYQDGEITHDWVVTVGTGSYPTPRGEFYVSLKRHMPTWVNPSPNGWGSNMPAQIGPGPGNPLGVRALNWSTMDGGATAIRFHGTQAVSQLGGAASHGCVRLSNAEVVELFDLVDEGAKIVSI